LGSKNKAMNRISKLFQNSDREAASWTVRAARGEMAEATWEL